MSLNPDTTDLRATPQSEIVANHPSMKREKSRALNSVFSEINNRSLGFEERLSARIAQAQGVLNALSASYDEDEDAFRPTPSVMKDALWAVSVLLKQADKAQRKLSEEIVALKRLVDPDREKE
jgi:hypothetical protein